MITNSHEYGTRPTQRLEQREYGMAYQYGYGPVTSLDNMQRSAIMLPQHQQGIAPGLGLERESLSGSQAQPGRQTAWLLLSLSPFLDLIRDECPL